MQNKKSPGTLQTQKLSAAPPVYRPAVAQLKTAAPPVYRPAQPAVSQPKAMVTGKPLSTGRTTAPPVYRPYPNNQPLLPKTKGTGAPPVYRPDPPATPAGPKPFTASALQPKRPGAPLPGQAAAKPQLRNSAIQRTPAEAEKLHEYGVMWFTGVWIKADSEARTKVLASLNKDFKKSGFSFSRGFQNYDPVVRSGGKASPYLAIVAAAVKEDDGGVTWAKAFLSWQTGGTKLDDLPHELADLAVITHFAEVGRGYRDSAERMNDWMTAASKAGSKAAAQKIWKEVNKWFAPSLKYKQDAFGAEGKYDPKDDVMVDDEEDNEEEQAMNERGSNLDMGFYNFRQRKGEL